MSRLLRLAVASLLHHRVKTITLVAALTLTLFAPFAFHLLLRQFQRAFLSRAEATPLVLGARGSRVDLVLHALSFAAQPDRTLTVADADAVRETGFATPLPLHFRHTARGVPVVGVPFEYFQFRNLTIAHGEHLAMLGDCVVGAQAAETLGLGPGDGVMTDLENVFNVAGEYPLRLRIRGVLSSTGTPDDEAIFVDLKTAWVADGIAHGHDDLAQPEQEDLLLSRGEDGTLVASAAVPQFTEITPENIASFHLHGERADLPVTAIIAVPHDEKSGVLLRGRYQGTRETTQIVVPTEVVTQVLDAVFRVKKLFDALFLSILLTTVLFLGLIVVLSLKLRAAEHRTMHHLGCSHGTIALLFLFEYAVIFLIALLLAGAMAWAAARGAEGLLPLLLR